MMSHPQPTSGEPAAQAQAPGEVIPANPAGPAGAAVDFRPDAGQGQQSQEQPEEEAAPALLQEQPTADGDQQQLSKQELESDSFRMFSFKVVQCNNPDETHDWTECPFAHVGEKANRRDPRLFRYTGISCPDYRKGACKRGSVCPYAHGVFEVWLHPSRYRTQLCKDGPHCSRQVCFFAHGNGELRQVAPEDLPVLEAGSAASSADGSTDGSEASSDAPAPAASLSSSSSSDSDNSSDSGCSTAAAAARCKSMPVPASSSEREPGAAAAGSLGSRGTAPTASKLQQIKPASLQQKQQQSLDWATAFSDPQLFMSRQASTASSISSGSHVSGLSLASFGSLGSQASLALSAGTPAKPGLALPHSAGGPGGRLLRVPLDIAVEAAAVAASAAGVPPLPLSDTFGSLTDPSSLGCPSPPLAQLHQQQALGALAGLAGDAAAAGPWPGLLPPAPHIGSGGSPADVAAQAAAAAAAHVGLLRQLGRLPGANPALAATMAAQQAAAAQQEMLHAALLQQQAAQQQQQQRDLMWAAAYNAASDVGLNPLTAAACADCAVQTAAAGPCGLPQPAGLPGCGAPVSQLQLLLQQQQHGSLAAAAAHPAGIGLQPLQQQQALLAGGPAVDALLAHKQLQAAGGLLGGCNGMVGGIPGMAALPECAAASYGFY